MVDSGDTLIRNLMQDMMLDRVSETRLVGTLPDAWQISGAFGGVTHAIAIRCMQRIIDRSDFVPLASHATFCRSVKCGPVIVDVDILRTGSSTVQAVANLCEAESEQAGVCVAATFNKSGFSEYLYKNATFPSWVPSPDRCVVPKARELIALPFFEQTDWVEAPETSLDAGAAPGPRSVAWNRFRMSPRYADGSMDWITSIAVFADNIGGPINNYFGVQSIVPMTLEMTVQFFGSTDEDWILSNSRVDFVSPSHVLGVIELWDAKGNLLGISSQRAMYRHTGR